MKTCIICKKEKELDCFSWKSKPKNTLQARCKPCYREMRNKWYQKNKEKEIATVVKYRIEKRKQLREWFWEFKSKLKCEQCGEKRTPTLQFHHIKAHEKEASLSEAITSIWPLKRIMKEVSKCKVLCANCHAMEHFNMKQEMKP